MQKAVTVEDFQGCYVESELRLHGCVVTHGNYFEYIDMLIFEHWCLKEMKPLLVKNLCHYFSTTPCIYIFFAYMLIFRYLFNFKCKSFSINIHEFYLLFKVNEIIWLKEKVIFQIILSVAIFHKKTINIYFNIVFTF